MMEHNFHGLPTRILENRFLRLEYLAEAGPRLVRLTLAGSRDNLFVELPEEREETPYGPFLIYGGHRLWHAPEAFPRSYIPDNSELEVEEIQDGVRLTGATEPGTGIRKRMEIHLKEDRPAITVIHTLSNAGLWPVELAPWSLSQLPLGGVMILPQPTGPLDKHGLLPNRKLVLWPYTSWQDPRLKLFDDLVLIYAHAQLPPLKIGYLNRSGWLGYLRSGILLLKRFEPRPDRVYPDFGCNAESYCNDKFIEMETLGSLTTLQPGETASHTENWVIIPGLEKPETIVGIREILAHLPA